MQISGEMIGLTAVVMGGLAVLIPIAGFTLRSAMKPIAEGLAHMREARGGDEAVALLERRMALVEEQLHGIDRSLRSLEEDAEFRRQLASAPPAAAAIGAGDGGRIG
jgi:hypothetical protein